MKKEILDNQRFGKLVVIKDSNKVNKRGHFIYAECLCDCGKTTTLSKSSLKRINGTKSCGCLSKKHFVDLTGKCYNNLTIQRYLGKDNCKNNIYECVCRCGGTIIAQGSDVKTGKIKSCGCGKYTKATQKAKEQKEETLINHLYAGYRRSGRNYNFNLGKEKFKELIFSNCYYCGSIA